VKRLSPYDAQLTPPIRPVIDFRFQRQPEPGVWHTRVIAGNGVAWDFLDLPCPPADYRPRR
jgi:hypothetical protein